jgi:hypothetical protein
MAGHPIRLWAAVTSSTGRPVDPEQCAGIIDGKRVARGPDTSITTPPGGEHRCTFDVRSGAGRTEVSVAFATVDPEKIRFPDSYRVTPGVSRPISRVMKLPGGNAWKKRRSKQ